MNTTRVERPDGRTLGRSVVLFALALIFTVGLTWASLEVPLLVSEAMVRALDLPGYDSAIQAEETEAFLRAHHVRWVGYGSLAAVVALIAVGLITEKRGLATAGAVAFFLPVFGHFAFSMFFLAGLGLLRFLWLPLLDLSYDVMRLGDVVWLPYLAPVWLAAVGGFDIRDPLVYALMGGGILIFVLGTVTWLEVRYRGETTATTLLYRFSRHPQYLGWIVWSYGLALYVSLHSMHFQFKIRWGIGSSLPWLIATLVIVGVALLEEIRMRREQGAEYTSWAGRTPFLLPLPRSVARAMGAPMRILLRKEWPETGREVSVVLMVYAFLLIALSVPFLVLDWPPTTGLYGFPFNVWPLRG